MLPHNLATKKDHLLLFHELLPKRQFFNTLYERVKLLCKRGLNVAEISAMVGRGQNVVLEYVEIARQHHPDLFHQAEEKG